MILLLDIGNSRIKWGRLESDEFRTGAPVLNPGPAGVAETVAKLLDDSGTPERILASNVAGPAASDAVTEECRRRWNVVPEFARSEAARLGVINAYRRPQQLGVDRWLSMVAAWSTGGGPLCVVGCGTALTLDLVDGRGQHAGGLIVPGPGLMQRALLENTGGIRFDAAADPSLKPGLTTAECVVNGTAYAAVALIERVVQGSRDEYGDWPRCVLTGGGAHAIGGLLKIDHETDPDLVLRGLCLMAKA